MHNAPLCVPHGYAALTLQNTVIITKPHYSLVIFPINFVTVRPSESISSYQNTHK